MDNRESLGEGVYSPHTSDAAGKDPFPYTLHSYRQQRGPQVDYGVAPACNGPCGGKWLPEGALLFTTDDGAGNLTYVAAYTDPLADPVHECGTRPIEGFRHRTLNGKSRATHEYLAQIREAAAREDRPG